jgi:Predicted membrane protein
LSYYYENRFLRIALGQAYIIVYSVLAAWMGVNYRTFIIIMLLIILTTYLQNRFLSRNPMSSVKARVEDVSSARKLIEEKNLRELQSKDEGLIADMQAQLRFTTFMMMSTLVGLLYFFIAWGHISDIYGFLKGYIGSDFLSHMLAFLVYLEGFFIISQASIEIALRRAGKIVAISMPNEYIVTTKGIVYRGLLSNAALAFPLNPHVAIRVEEKRGFVDIVNEGKVSLTILRLYSRDPKRLYEILRRYGVPKGSS